MLKNLLLTAMLVATPAAMQAQHSGYAEHTGREIKALAPDRIEGLRNGDGLGYALAAELNGYPGPKHVLELDQELTLTEEQRAATQVIFDRMNAAARDLGAQLIAAERTLDSLFVTSTADPTRLETQLATIGSLEARLRYTHLVAHLEVTTLLTEQQIAHYQMVRGYADHSGHR